MTMDHFLMTAGLLVFAFLWGGIPVGYIVVKLIKDTDIRKQGSGNIGASNVRRVLGNSWFFGVLLLDALKGAVPMLGGLFFPNMGSLERVFIAAITICGNLFSPWLGFRGGKGIGTGLGVLAVLAPLPMLCVIAVFVAALLVSNYVSFASMLATIALPCAIFLVEAIRGIAHDVIPLGFAILLAIAILIMHRSNISRLASGNERKFFAKGKAD
jgi:acyl phosphate:glycerol-3-phosphate acyltransferase